MSERRASLGRLVTGAGGTLLVVSLFLPWAEAGEMHRTGFQLLALGDVFLLTVGAVSIATALTWKRYGLFRPDLSMNAAADLLGLVATIALTWMVLVDFPSGSGRGPGIFLALAAALAITAGSGDYATLGGAPWFPRLDDEG